jgi:hypothetical protein
MRPKPSGDSLLTCRSSATESPGCCMAICAALKQTTYESLKLPIGITNCEANSASWSVQSPIL